MSVRKVIIKKEGIFFITFSCFNWLNLFDITNSYNAVYKWFDNLRDHGHFIVGYVIMPNHVHILICFTNIHKSINRIIGNGKRFLAYEIINRLKLQQNQRILSILSDAVSQVDKKLKNKLHEVFHSSFDWKECLSTDFIEQKLNYMHNNPFQPKWKLVEDPVNYIHSSACYYLTGEEGIYPVTHYEDLEDRYRFDTE